MLRNTKTYTFLLRLKIHHMLAALQVTWASLKGQSAIYILLWEAMKIQKSNKDLLTLTIGQINYKYNISCSSNNHRSICRTRNIKYFTWRHIAKLAMWAFRTAAPIFMSVGPERALQYWTNTKPFPLPSQAPMMLHEIWFSWYLSKQARD